MKYTDLLKSTSVCPFCLPERNKSAILENDTAFLTYCIAPYHADHFLVIPKRHIKKLLDISEQEAKDLNSLQRQALLILNKFGYENISILAREGDRSAKSIAHLHYHVIPDVRLGDTDHVGLDRRVMTKEEIQRLLSKVKDALLTAGSEPLYKP